MDFDLLVRKYLRGSLSEEELQRLRTLIETRPEYRTELRQILEFRSALRDDALRLIPPRELSERTRMTVGGRFAGVDAILKGDAGSLVPPRELADATLENVSAMFAASATRDLVPAPAQSDESDRKRAVIIPWRYAFSGLAAAVIGTFLALGPEIVSTLDVPRAGTLSAPATPRQPEAGAPGSERSIRSADSEPLAAATADVSSSREAQPRAASAAVVAAATPTDVTTPPAAAAAAAPPAESAAPPSVDASGATAVAEVEIPVVRSMPAADARSSERTPIRGNGSALARSSNGRSGPHPIPVVAAYESLPTLVREVNPRLMSVGVTVGSGGVAEDNTPTPLLQNSYYLSFSLGTHDRIGVEMGGSTFMQERLVPERRPGSGGFGKGKSADDTGRAVALVSSEPGVSMVSQRAPQPITYGGVFYDRRLPINTSWDLCGRVTFGATDGAIVSGVRAYAAFSPTPNVTLTLGVGGSTLFNLTKRVDPSSVNYGVYYGVETGF